MLKIAPGMDREGKDEQEGGSPMHVYEDLLEHVRCTSEVRATSNAARADHPPS